MVVAVAELSPAPGSAVVEETDAVLLMFVPDAVPPFTWTTIEKLAEAPDPRLACVQVIVPVAPTPGVLHTQPAGKERAWKLVGAAITSLN